MSKKNISYLLVFFALINIVFSQNNIKINEVVSSNSLSAIDEDYDSPDWIELYNSSNEPVNLKGWRIADKSNFNSAWEFPDTIIPPNSHLVLFCSDKNRTSSNNLIIEAAGYGIASYTKSDAFRFEYVEIEGNFEIRVNIRSLRECVTFGQGGLVIREKLTADCRYLGFLCMIKERGGLILLNRETEDSYPKRAYPRRPEDYPYEYITLKREGDTVIYSITDKNNFPFEQNKAYFPCSNKVYIGVAFSSADSKNLGRLTISNLYLNGEILPYSSLQSIEFNTEIPGKSYISNELHTNFKLSKDGEKIYLWNAQKALIDTLTFFKQSNDISSGLFPDGVKNLKYYSKPTPSKPNINPYDGETSSPSFSKLGGVYQEEFLLELNSSNNDKIYYTTNFEEPNDTNSILYESPIPISKNTVIRARAIRDDFIPSHTVTHTYIFNEPKNLPVISIVADSFSLWQKQRGIFHQNNLYERYENPAHFQYWEKNSNFPISCGAGIRLHGGATRFYPQKSMRLYAKSKYGEDLFSYRFWGNEGLKEYEKFIVRNAGQDWFGAFFRDGLVTNIVKDFKALDAAAFKPVSTYLNGEYWGLFNLRERLDEDYLALKYDIPVESINYIETYTTIKNGTNYDMVTMTDSVISMEMSNNEAYNYIDNKVDLNNLIDYTFTEVYIANLDWPANNLRAWNSDKLDKKWRWLVYDMDNSFGLFAEYDWFDIFEFSLNQTTKFGQFFWKLMENDTFKVKFINRSADILNSYFQAKRIKPIVDSLANQIRIEVPRQQERWDSSIVNWQHSVDYIKHFVEKRPGRIANQYVSHFELPGISNLVLSSNIPNSCSFKVNTIIPDTIPWNAVYFQSIPVTITVIPNENYIFGGWSDSSLTFNETITVTMPENYELQAIMIDKINKDTSIVINEIMYNPNYQYNSKDWIELYNPTSKPINLSNWILKNSDNEIDYIFQNITLEPDNYIVIAQDTNSYSNYYLNTNKLGNFEKDLYKVDKLILFDKFGRMIDSVSFSNQYPWDSNADGTGYSLELTDYHLDNNIPSSWKAAIKTNGTPGEKNSTLTSIEFCFDCENDKIHLANYPNPFTNSTQILYNLPEDGNVNLTVYTSTGSELVKLVNNQWHTKGHYQIIFSSDDIISKNLSPGVYFCRLELIGKNNCSYLLPIVNIK